MSGHDLVVGTRRILYLTPDDDVPVDADVLVGFDFFDDLLAKRHRRMRRVITTLAKPTPRFYGLLHWSDGTDLGALDALVQRGEADSSDFESALLTELHSITCRNCESTYRAALVDAGNPLATSARIASHRFIESCPHCGTRFGLHVAELLDDQVPRS